MADVKAAGAYVTISIKEEMRQGLAQAQAKIAAFADFAKSKTSNMFDFSNIGKFIAGGAVIGFMTKLAMNNKMIASSAEEAMAKVQALFDTFVAQNESSIQYAFEGLSFLFNKLVNGLRAIIALGQDFFAVFQGDTSFTNFNRVLDTLDPSPVNNTKKAMEGVSKAAMEAARATELFRAQQDKVWELEQKAKNAGQSDIQGLLRESQVAQSGETNVRAQEIYDESMQASIAAMEAQGINSGPEQKEALERAKQTAQALKEQYLFLAEQKRIRDEQAKAAEKEKEIQKKMLDLERDKAKIQETYMKAWRERAAGVASFSGGFDLMRAGRGASAFDTTKSLLEEAKAQKEYLKEIRDNTREQQQLRFE